MRFLIAAIALLLKNEGPSSPPGRFSVEIRRLKIQCFKGCVRFSVCLVLWTSSWLQTQHVGLYITQCRARQETVERLIPSPSLQERLVRFTFNPFLKMADAT